MPALTKPADHYLEAKIATATKEELTLMLYEGALKFCNQAVVALEKNDLMKMNLLVRKTCEIIRELHLTLDPKYPISGELDNLYTFMMERITTGAADKNVAALNDVGDLLREFRDMWKQAMATAKTGNKNAGR